MSVSSSVRVTAVRVSAVVYEYARSRSAFERRRSWRTARALTVKQEQPDNVGDETGGAHNDDEFRISHLYALRNR